MSEHTSGPWLAQGRYIGVKGHMSYIGECSDQNGNWTNEPMAVANARLIAAAPELLEALKDATEGLEIASAGGGVDFYAYAKTARAAINKVEGGAA